MHLITTSEVGSVDERIHTLADRRMVISLMNGAFDQDLNGLLCRSSCVCINSEPFQLHNVLTIHREMGLSCASECRERARERESATLSKALITLWDWLCAYRRHFGMQIRTSGLLKISNERVAAPDFSSAPCGSRMRAATQRWCTVGHKRRPQRLAQANKLWDKIGGNRAGRVECAFQPSLP